VGTGFQPKRCDDKYQHRAEKWEPVFSQSDAVKKYQHRPILTPGVTLQARAMSGIGESSRVAAAIRHCSRSSLFMWFYKVLREVL